MRLLKSGTSYVHWTDVTMGKSVGSFATREGPLDVMAQNPANALLHCGHAKGTVSLWSPNQPEAVVKLLAHGGPVRGLAVHKAGRVMATAGQEGRIRLWDLRMWKPLWAGVAPAGLGRLAFSATGLLAAANGTTVHVYKDVMGANPFLYMEHAVDEAVTDLEFAPFEDVLGIGHRAGFTSILVPGHTHRHDRWSGANKGRPI